MITFITYNISEDRDLFAKLIQYVAAKDNRIVAVQEARVADKRSVQDGVQIIPNAESGSQQCFLVSKNLKVTDKGHCHKKIHAISLLMPDQEELWVINVHAYAPNGNDNRGSQTYGIFSLLNFVYSMRPNRIICGDFNLNPFHEAVACKGIASICARRDLEDLDTDSDALYNPSWRFVRERKKSRGTHRFDLTATVGWQMFDQIVLSKKYASNIETLVIPKKLGSIDTDAARLGTRGTGHLPLLCTVNMQEAHK